MRQPSRSMFAHGLESDHRPPSPPSRQPAQHGSVGSGCRLRHRGSGLRLLARVTDAEREHDLHDALEQREEAHPEQDEVRALGERVDTIGPGHPEGQQDQQV
jgi:hypothetical protein